MPAAYNPGSGQDWESTNVGRATIGRTTVPKTAREITQAKASGLLATEKRGVGQAVCQKHILSNMAG